MRVLITSLPGHGHLGPLIPLATATRDAGHEVAIATSGTFRETLERHGLALEPCGPMWRESDFGHSFDQPHLLVDLGKFLSLEVTSRILADMGAAAARFRPDVIVSNDYEPNGRVVAERTGIPFVLASSGPRVPRSLRERLQARLLQAARLAGGLPATGELDYTLRWLHICFSPREHWVFGPGGEMPTEAPNQFAIRPRIAEYGAEYVPPIERRRPSSPHPQSAETHPAGPGSAGCDSAGAKSGTAGCDSSGPQSGSAGCDSPGPKSGSAGCDSTDSKSGAAGGDSISPKSGAPGRPGPVTLCTFGTVFNKEPRLFRTVISAIAPRVRRLLVLPGPGMPPESLAPLPENVELLGEVALSSVLPFVDYVVSHGGTATLSAAQMLGKPCLLLPLGADQIINAAACQRSGLSVVRFHTIGAVNVGASPLGPMTEASVREAFDELIAEPAYPARAAAFRRALEALPPMESAIPLLEQLATTRTPVLRQP